MFLSSEGELMNALCIPLMNIPLQPAKQGGGSGVDTPFQTSEGGFGPPHHLNFQGGESLVQKNELFCIIGSVGRPFFSFDFFAPGSTSNRWDEWEALQF